MAESLGLRSDVWLQDLVGLGCGAAIPALRATSAMLAAAPDSVVACVAVEVCSAAFYLDNDPGVIISACLFGDGAAATPATSARRTSMAGSPPPLFPPELDGRFTRLGFATGILPSSEAMVAGETEL